MIMRRKLYLLSITVIISALSIWFVLLDFSRFGSLDYTYDIAPGGILKRVCVLLASFIAWTVGRVGLSLKDSSRMKWALLFACIGETAFFFRSILTGLVMFSACQLLLIIRNSTGLRFSLKHPTDTQKKKLFVSVIIVFLIFLSGLLLTGALTKLNTIVTAVCFYWSILNISLLAGLACYILGLLPGKNAGMASSGVVCFYCCDILVGLDAVLEPGLPWLLANSFIWIFYIPALVLLSLSCYKYD